MAISHTCRVLVLGAAGMLGNAVFRLFAQSDGFHVTGAARSASARTLLAPEFRSRLEVGIDVENSDQLTALFVSAAPDLVINCIGLVKQLAQADDPLCALPLNALLPHRLARLCGLSGSRLIHVSTDCVFAGDKGMYREEDTADATDLYGRSKYLGEVDYPHAITLRTSIIGHQLDGVHGLVGWFLAQEGRVKGFTRAVFSGLPTVELARVMRDFVVPHAALHGVFHVSAAPIAKYELLRLLAREYDHSIEILPDDAVVVDRSLDSTRFCQATGYVAPDWPELIERMRRFH